MKKVIASVLALTLLTPAIALAHPGPWGPGPGPHWGGPGPLHFLPDAATAVLIGGLTYYLLNGSYYQRQGENYVVVQPPQPVPVEGMRVLDFNGRRYYVQEGHYYQRDINGSYTEVPRPYGL
ncbi:MAG: hypothetical protein PW844_13465 [Pantoea sp.]|uniref:DUF6515 family protein n=1 Tax=unclassified Pantoea TaxID=2630326 RepID=UPI0023981A15|nr:DUF6515 family protein [Pantoea sp.]MDE1187469.1 hypothetical protein [Pantoea sp.]